MEGYDYKKHSPLGLNQDRLGYDQIRLLKLHPGSGTMDLRCTLIIRAASTPRYADHPEPGLTLKVAEPYDALSYYWGPKRGGFFIEVLAGSEAHRIAITPNLEAALRQLRSEQTYRLLWVDALCIDQEDENEKSSQIGKMSQIYNGAEHVRVWLGVEEGDSAKAMEFVKKCLDLDDFDRLVRDSFASKEWAALSALMRRPWFNRRWIIQEIALAKRATLHCGKDSVPWREFADVISLLERNQYEIRQLFRESTAFRNHPDYFGDLTELGAVRLVSAAENLFRKSEDGRIMEKVRSLEALMSSLSAFEASEPRDTVYAILWLANDARPAARDAWVMDSEKASAQQPGCTAPVAGLPSATSHVSSEKLSLEPKITASQLYRRSSAAASICTEAASLHTLSENLVPAGGDLITSTPAIHDHDEDQIADRATESMGTTTGGIDKAADCMRLQEHHSVTGDCMLPEHRPGKHPRSNDTVRGETEQLTEKRRKAVTMLLSAMVSRRIAVDYTKDIFHVFKGVLESIITRSRSLDMICRPWAPDLPGLPSWIPQLSNSAFGLGVNGVYRRINADPLVGRPGMDTWNYKAAGSYPAVWMMKAGYDKSLFVRGFVLSTIKEKKAPATAGIIPSEWIDAVSWSRSDDLTEHQFWRLLVGNRDANGYRPPSRWHMACRDALSRKPARGDLNTGEIIMYDCPSATREFLERVQGMVWSRRLIVLDKLPCRHDCLSPQPVLGLAPSRVKKGDLICILFGCSVPVVLRKFVNGQPASKKLILCERCKSLSPSNGSSQDNAPIPRPASDVPDSHVYYEFVG